ncbi:uncharacterized protein LOC132180500 [Corylus avellana]|uniref:uncharacterized protein LOC132180500 n=1 Tax=Corylus avellana TaxID=13451 RepID=UPI001E238787|nr:uncharacterized protein LOC132180500 [Corylus avellana]
MESNSLELKVLSCKDLRAFNFFQKLSGYALVSIVSDDPNKKLERNQKQRTPADGEGDGNPEWNQEMQFDLNEISFEDCDHLFLHFDLRHQGVMFGDKSIGEVRVGFKDLTQESNLGAVRFVSYQVQASDGKPNGVLNFSYKVSGKIGTTTTPSSSSSHEIHYPTLELVQNLSEEQEPLSAPQYLQEYPSSHQTYYPPAAADAYYPPPPPPPHPLFPPRPPPMLHGACYHPRRPHLYPWAPEVYEFGGPGGGGSSDGGQPWSNGVRAGRYRPAPSYWNGR